MLQYRNAYIYHPLPQSISKCKIILNKVEMYTRKQRKLTTQYNIFAAYEYSNVQMQSIKTKHSLITSNIRCIICIKSSYSLQTNCANVVENNMAVHTCRLSCPAILYKDTMIIHMSFALNPDSSAADTTRMKLVPSENWTNSQIFRERRDAACHRWELTSVSTRLQFSANFVCNYLIPVDLHLRDRQLAT